MSLVHCSATPVFAVNCPVTVITALTPMSLRTQGGMIKLPPPAAPEAEKPAAASVEVDAAALKKSTVVQLKKKLKDLGLGTTGKKDVLIERLVANVKL